MARLVGNNMKIAIMDKDGNVIEEMGCKSIPGTNEGFNVIKVIQVKEAEMSRNIDDAMEHIESKVEASAMELTAGRTPSEETGPYRDRLLLTLLPLLLPDEFHKGGEKGGQE